MPARFASAFPPQRLRAIFAVPTGAPNWPPSWNIAPSGTAPVVRRRPSADERSIDILVWGFEAAELPAADVRGRPFNARAETVEASRLFGPSFRERRCLVPADAFYEWRRDADGAQPFAFARMDGRPVALAGFWNRIDDEGGGTRSTFAVLTTAASRIMRPIHERMPVVIEEADWGLWLGETAGDPLALLQPPPPEVLRCWPVSRRLDDPGSDDPGLLQPVD